MDPTVAKALDQVHPQRLEDVRPAMAKADLKKVETAHREAHGKVLARALELAGVSRKEGAALLDLDETTLSRQLAAKEAQQTWRWQQHPRLGPALLLAQAEDETGVVVRHVIEVAI
jgi:hypothetical protein